LPVSDCFQLFLFYPCRESRHQIRIYAITFFDENEPCWGGVGRCNVPAKSTRPQQSRRACQRCRPGLPLDGARSWSTIDEVAGRAAPLAEPSASRLRFLERATAPRCKGSALSIRSRGFEAAACLGMPHTVSSQALKRRPCLLTSTAWCSSIRRRRFVGGSRTSSTMPHQLNKRRTNLRFGRHAPRSLKGRLAGQMSTP